MFAKTAMTTKKTAWLYFAIFASFVRIVINP